MKFFSFTKLALLATTICFNLSSCTKDDGLSSEDNDLDSNSKKLSTAYTHWRNLEGSGEDYVKLEFSYNNNGKLVFVSREDFDSSLSRKETRNYYYEWNNNSVVETVISGNDKFTTTYTLNNNKVTNDECNNFLYTSEGKLSSINGKSTNIEFLWSNDKLIQEYRKNYDSYRTYTYTGKTCKGWLPCGEDIWIEYFEYRFIFMAHPELVGINSTNLPDKKVYAHSIEGTFSGSYSYTFTKDGYIENFKVVWDDDPTEFLEISYTWE